MQPTMRVIIPSRKRVNILKRDALAIFPYATVVVAESEKNDYSFCTDLVTHPDDVSGIAPIRQWCLDKFDDELILFVDDDVQMVVSLVGYRPTRYSDPGDIAKIVSNAANVCRDLNLAIFGFNQSWDIRKFNPLKPIKLNSWVGGVIGFCGRGVRYDTRLKMRADVDVCMQSLLKQRIVYTEDRFSFIQTRFALAGGNAVNRSESREKEELGKLMSKWGGYVKISTSYGGTRNIAIHIDR